MVLRIWPNDASGAVSVPVPLKATSDGGPKLTRLKTLKISTRSWTLAAGAERRPRHDLGERQIRRPQVRPDQIVAADVAERADRLQHERRRIEPAIRIAGHRVVGSAAGRVARAIGSGARARATAPTATAIGWSARTR